MGRISLTFSLAAVAALTAAVDGIAVGGRPTPSNSAAAPTTLPPLDVSSLPSWRLRTAVSTLEGIRGRDGSQGGGTRSESGNLDLLTDFHDPETGLCSEGVWHNSVLGIALLKASRALRDGGSAEEGSAAESLADEYRIWARRIAFALIDLNYSPGLGFRRRTSSGRWGSVEDSPEALDEGGDFYLPGEERNCAPNALAVAFLTFLMEEFPGDESVSSAAMGAADSFLDEFFDRGSGRFLSVAGAGEAPPRAVDQAMGVLACLRLLRAMEFEGWSGGGVGGGRKKFEVRTMAAASAESLLDDFNYGPYASEGLVPPINTLGGGSVAGSIPEYRNSWHDSLACFAILASNACSGRESPVGLCRFMARDYGIVSPDDSSEGDDGNDDKEGGSNTDADAGRRLLLAHDTQENRFRDGPNAYTCTQAIFDLCRRTVESETGNELRGFGDFRDGLRGFLEGSSLVAGGGERGAATLAPVGTKYPQIRLWANTELAAWLMMDPEDFSI